MFHRRHLLAATGLLAAGALAGSRRAWAAERRIVVGQSVPLTGPASEIGLAFAAGAKLQFDAFNARQAARAGWRFALRQLDDAGNPARAGGNARRLLDEGADLLFGFAGTGSCDAGSLVARQREAIFFAPFGAADRLRGPGARHVFHVRPSLADEARRMVAHCASLGQERIAVLGEDDALAHAGIAAVTQALADRGRPPLVARAFVPAHSDRLDDVMARVLETQPQVVIQASLFQATAVFISRLRRAGYTGSFMNFSVVGIDPLFTALGGDARGVIVPQVVPSPRTPTTPLVREYLAALETSDQAPSCEGLEGFIAAKALVEAARRAGGMAGGRQALFQAMETMTQYDVGGLVLNLRAGLRDTVRPVDLVALRADGKLLR